MKQRITYVVEKPDEFSPEQLGVKNVGQADPRFALQGVHAAKEHRITLALSELPGELRNIFQQWHELHVRWASSTSFIAIPPFTSRVSPGLHVFFTPLDSTSENTICEQLHSVISPDVKCSSMNESAIKLPLLPKSSGSTTSQYYAYLDSVETIINNIAKHFCKGSKALCQILAEDVATATSLDIDFDTTSRAVVLTASWPSAPNSEGWSDEITLPHKDSTVEIGVLSHEPNADPEDIQFGGFLTVLGQDAAPKATRFQTTTRHYPLLDTSSSSLTPRPHPLTYLTFFSQPTGLHPTLILSFPKQHLTPPDPSCKLYTHLTLSSYLFIDRYQFNDPLFLSSKHLTRLARLAGATDLEAPDWIVPAWGSAALFQLSHPMPASGESSTQNLDQRWNVSIPLHLRYLPASATSHMRVPLPWPVVFWACRAEEAEMMVANPFDRVHLGYEALFGRETRFMHVQPAPEGDGVGRLVEWIDVPVLDTRRSGMVEGGTVGVVVVAFLGLCWVLFGGRGRRVKGLESKKRQ